MGLVLQGRPGEDLHAVYDVLRDESTGHACWLAFLQSTASKYLRFRLILLLLCDKYNIAGSQDYSGADSLPRRVAESMLAAASGIVFADEAVRLARHVVMLVFASNHPLDCLPWARSMCQRMTAYSIEVARVFLPLRLLQPLPPQAGAYQ